MILSDSILVRTSSLLWKLSEKGENVWFLRILNKILVRLRVHQILVRLLLRLGAKPVVEVKMKDGSNILVDLRSENESGVYYSREYDSGLIKIIENLLNPDLYFFDIGANIGFYSVAIGTFIKSKKSAGRVIAFEPLDSNYKRLTENLIENKLYEHCLAYNLGLSDRSCDAQIVLREDFIKGAETGNCSVSINDEVDGGLIRKKIRLEKLDTLWPEINLERKKIDIIKMDIEGHEDFCLEGACQTIKTQRPVILMEVNKPYYEARGVQLDERFIPLIPENYSNFRFNGSGWVKINSFYDCSDIDNVFLIPNERLELEAYKFLM